MSQTRQYRKTKSDPLEVRAALGLLKAVAWLVTLPFKRLGVAASRPVAPRRQPIDTADIANRWRDIEMQVGLGGASHFGTAVVAADKLVDHILKQSGYAGETMGERLRSAESSFSPRVYQGLWRAHKLRNTLVHDLDHDIMAHDAKDALEQFRAALHELGVLR